MRGLNFPRLKIRLLGEFQILAGEKSIPGFSADRPQSLLAYLLLHGHAPQSRQHLAFLLWPDSKEGQARTNLRNLLHTLRNLLPAADTYLLVDNKTVQWNLEAAFDLDVTHFEKALKAAALAENHAAMREYLETAVMIYEGDLLPGNYDEWLIPAREEMRQQYLDALGRLVSVLEAIGEFRPAVRFSRCLWQQDMLDETTAVQLMRLLATCGDRAGVQRVYEALVANLDCELCMRPSPATQEAYQKFLHHNAATFAADLAPLAFVEQPPRPLPIPVTTFVGREQELADIAQRLSDPDCRLLTLAGLNGMGKTRLVLQTAVEQAAVFGDGVAYASLTACQSTDLVAAAIANALSFSLSDADDAWARIGTFLSGRAMLLVLDNVDHIFFTGQEMGGEQVEERLAALLQSAPRLKLLVTSRQGLGLMGEWMYEIRGMAVPETAVADDLVDNGAIRLFIQSARRVDNQFVLAPEDPGHILHICHLVDGMPLGIELAASWVRLLSCKEIAEEMAHSMDFLRSELRNVPERHRSVRASFDLSWGLLSHAEKLVLARLSVYSGVFGRDAAELEAGATLEILAGLVNKSLLTRVGTGQFKLHNLVRQYAALHLEELNSSLPTAQRAYMPERAPRVVMAGRNAWQS